MRGTMKQGARGRAGYTPPPPPKWIPARVERLEQVVKVFNYLYFVAACWQDVEPEFLVILTIWTDWLRAAEWPRDAEDAATGTPMFERIARREKELADSGFPLRGLS